MAKREEIAKLLGSIEHALDYLLANFVIVRKNEFRGISGYFCEKCLSFQYPFIRTSGMKRLLKPALTLTQYAI